MNPIMIRGVAIGEGIPKICVPIVGKTREEIVKAAEEIRTLPVDVVEWRADWYEEIFEADVVLDVLQELRRILGELPLLFTFRTKKEGGEKEIDEKNYRTLNQLAAESGLADLIDVEVFSGDEVVNDLVRTAHENEVKVIGSNHDFEKTPSKEEIIRRLQKMQELDVDLPKIAVMPRKKEDVLTLLAATEEMNRKYADRPIITMSMAGDGIISRLCGEVFGSALTFGAAGQASAPGQIGVKELRQILTILHESV